MTSSPPDTRASLILRLPDAHDAAAWDEFVEVYGRLVYRIGLRQGMQAADADDLVQEVLTAVAQSVGRWLEREDRGKFRAWLLRIARNTAVNLLTRRQHRTPGLGGDDAQTALRQVPESSLVTSQFDLEYRRQVFRWAAQRVQELVSDTTWQSFWLTHVQQQPIEQVARKLNVTVGTVYVGRSRVMSRMREMVKQFEDVE